METSKWMWMVWLLVGIELAITWVGNHLGLWYVAFAISIANGFVLRRTITAMWASYIACIGGWGLALAWQALFAPIGRTATIVAGIMGLGSHGIIVIVLALLLPFLFATSGTWLAKALSRIARPPSSQADRLSD